MALGAPGLVFRATRTRLLAGAALASLVLGCEERSDTRIPAPTPPPPVRPAEPLSATPSADPPQPDAQAPKGRALKEILAEAAEIAGASPNYEDPEADYAARVERPFDLSLEIAAGGADALGAVLEALEASPSPLQREVLNRAFARIASGLAPDFDEALEETAKELHRFAPRDLEVVCDGLPRGRAARVLEGWLGRLSSPPGPQEGPLRLALLKRYARAAQDRLGGKPFDQALLERLTQDPDAAVATAARQLKG